MVGKKPTGVSVWVFFNPFDTFQGVWEYDSFKEPKESDGMTDESPSMLSREQIEEAERQIQERQKRIEYYITEYSIELLATKMRNGDFFVPDYQRAFTWEESRKWRFIESILMGLPIPFLFFSEHPRTGKLEIVDGSQRLRTLEEYIHDGLTLHDLEKLPALEGFKFSDLPEARQRKIKNRSIRGIILSEHADDEARFDLFDRINTGSKVANKAEIRRGALGGGFLDLVIGLAEEPLFKELAPVTDKQLKQREREELVTRFFAYGDGLDDYDEEVAPFLFAYTRKMNLAFKQRPGLARSRRQEFMRVMKFVKKTFPYGFRRSPTGTVTPRVRFEAIAIGSRLALQEKRGLKVDPRRIKNWLDGEEFARFTRSDAANVRSKLEGRLYFVRDRLLEDAE